MASKQPNSAALRKEYDKQLREQQKMEKGESQKHPKRLQVMPVSVEPASSSHADEADGLEDSSPGAVASKKPGRLKKSWNSVKKTFSGSGSKKKEGEEGGTVGGGGGGREWERDLLPETPPSQRKKSSYDEVCEVLVRTYMHYAKFMYSVIYTCASAMYRVHV